MNTAEAIYAIAPFLIGLIPIIGGLVLVFKQKPKSNSKVEFKGDGVSISRVSAGVLLVILGAFLIYARVGKGITFFPNGQPSTIRTTTGR